MHGVEHDEIVRLYGPWRHLRPGDAAGLLREYRHRWWIAGGWAIEAFTGVERAHGDLDLGIFRSDVPLFREFMVGRLDVWAADGGTLTPLAEDDAVIPATCGNLWLRPSGAEPWEYDVILETAVGGQWRFKRDPRIALPVAEIVWRVDGITYLRPEIELLYKASSLRARDQHDFQACRPLLSERATAWLRSALQTAHPGHEWIAH